MEIITTEKVELSEKQKKGIQESIDWLKKLVRTTLFCQSIYNNLSE